MNPFAWARAEVLHWAWKQGLYQPPDRRVLTEKILGSLAKDPDILRILFVGVQWYTKDYAQLVPGKVFATIDPDEKVAPYGGTPHVVGFVQNLEEHFDEEEDDAEPFDAIVMSGVIGFGLNEREGVERALEACARKLRKNGWLVLGVNELKPTHVDPSTTRAAEHFTNASFYGLGKRIDVALPFREKRHTFVFWKRK
jgi:hypothetical protein